MAQLHSQRLDDEGPNSLLGTSAWSGLSKSSDPPLKFSTWKAENDVFILSSVHPLLAILAQDRFVLPPLDRADCPAENGPLK